MAVDSEGVFYLAGYTDDFYFPVTPNAYLTANGGVRREFCLRHRHQAARKGRPDLLDLLRRNHHGYTHRNRSRRRQDLRHRVYEFRRLSGHRERLSEHAPGRNFDGFVAEIDPSQSGTAGLVASTYLGGSGQDVPRSIAVAADGQVYVAGYTRSGDFPTTPNSFRPFYSGGGDAFLTRLDLNARPVTYSTFLGGSGQDQATKILVEPSGHVAVTGFTLSDDFPVTPDALQSTPGRKRRRVSDHSRSRRAGFHHGPGLLHLLRRNRWRRRLRPAPRCRRQVLSLRLHFVPGSSHQKCAGAGLRSRQQHGRIRGGDRSRRFAARRPGLLQLPHRAGISGRVRRRCGRARQHLRHRHRFRRCLRGDGSKSAARQQPERVPAGVQNL